MSVPLSDKPVKVDVVVQDYMDCLLADLFPDVTQDLAEPSQAEAVQLQKIEPAPPTVLKQAIADEVKLDLTVIAEEPVSTDEPQAETTALTPIPHSAPVPSQVKIETPVTLDLPSAPPQPDLDTLAETSLQQITLPTVEPQELKYPDAPLWAQQAFDVLLFDVCGLKLAVCMEALGRIIKVEHETNHIIGRPQWFLGAYNDSEHHLYVVDTAKFIMPEKGFDLTALGFDYIIQLQRSKWTLACKDVHSTVRLEPDQVKWRSTKGKRRWLAGTVIEHMCALIHVDTLVELLESENGPSEP